MENDREPLLQADTAFAAAQRYIQRGWSVIPIPHRSKKTKSKGWQQWRIKLEELDRWFPASKPWNIGVLLGEPSGWLIDIDLDHLRAIEIAPKYLPLTPLMFGRAGKPKSHWLFRATKPFATKKFASRSSGMLVEVRSTGCQTVFPPSTHESGEAIEWIDEQQQPAEIDPDELVEAASRLADAVSIELGEKAAPRQKEQKTRLILPSLQLPTQPVLIDMDERANQCLAALEQMKLEDSKDGSRRLFAAACRCVEFDLSDEAALQVIGKYSKQHPFATAWGSQSVLKRLRSAEQRVERGSALQRRIIPSMLSVGQLLKHHPELRPPVITGLLRTGETMNIIAPPKYGKSWLVTDLAMAVATGRRWLDAFETTPGNVLILDNELHSETSANRIPKVATARGILLPEIADKLFIDNLRGRLLDVYTLQPYFEAIQKEYFKLIVMDAFYRFLPKDSDENSNANMTDVYNRLDWYAAMLGCCFVLVHHASKGNQSGKSITDVGAGAGSQARATDTHLILRQHQEDGCVVVDAAVRSWQPLDSLCLRWSFPVWSIDDSLDPADLRPERPRKKAKLKDEQHSNTQKWTQDSFVTSFVSDEPTTMKEIMVAAKESGITQRMARDMIQLTEGAGLIYRWTFGSNRPVKFATIPQPSLVGN
jgi:hypothetical protein